MGRFGHEFLEFELTGERLRYANNSKCVCVLGTGRSLTPRSYRSALKCLLPAHMHSNDSLIRKEMFLSPIAISEIKRIIAESEIVKEDDVNCTHVTDPRRAHTAGPKKNVVGRQELEIRIGNDHIAFETAKIGSLNDVQDSEDPEGMRVFYYLIQDLRVRPSAAGASLTAADVRRGLPCLSDLAASSSRSSLWCVRVCREPR